MITPRNGHGKDLAAHADNADEVRAAVRGRIAAGADAIKIVATGGVHTPGSDLMAAQYTESTRCAPGIEEAHAARPHGRQPRLQPARDHQRHPAGVDTIEHGIFLDDEAAETMARHATTFVPTLAATHLYEPNAGHPAIPDYVREKAALTVPAHRENFPRAVRAGVKLATGTDAGSTFVDHGVVAVEVELLASLRPVAAGGDRGRNEERGRGHPLDQQIGDAPAGPRRRLARRRRRPGTCDSATSGASRCSQRRSNRPRAASLWLS